VNFGVWWAIVKTHREAFEFCTYCTIPQQNIKNLKPDGRKHDECRQDCPPISSAE